MISRPATVAQLDRVLGFELKDISSVTPTVTTFFKTVHTSVYTSVTVHIDSISCHFYSHSLL